MWTYLLFDDIYTIRSVESNLNHKIDLRFSS
jgi:hypothetical protein